MPSGYCTGRHSVESSICATSLALLCPPAGQAADTLLRDQPGTPKGRYMGDGFKPRASAEGLGQLAQALLGPAMWRGSLNSEQRSPGQLTRSFKSQDSWNLRHKSLDHYHCHCPPTLAFLYEPCCPHLSGLLRQGKVVSHWGCGT